MEKSIFAPVVTRFGPLYGVKFGLSEVGVHGGEVGIHWDKVRVPRGEVMIRRVNRLLIHK